MTDKNCAYLISRLAIGLSFFGHGLVRLPKLTGFSHWMVGQFSNFWNHNDRKLGSTAITVDTRSLFVRFINLLNA